MAYPTSIPTPKLTIRYKGLFDYDALYNMMVRWLKARRYWFHETVYKHKVPSPYGAEQEIAWEADKKINDYIRYWMNISWHLWDINEVEVIKDGEKKTLTNARVEILIGGTVEVDYEKRLQRNRAWIAIADIFYKYFLKEDIESIHHDTLYYRIYRLHALIKEHLGMEAKGNEYESYLGDNA